MASTAHLRRRARFAVCVLVLAISAGDPLGSAAEASYGWPIRPFDAQHLVSGTFGEPRQGAFHHGVDIRARDGTPVYATLSGTVFAINNRRDALGISSGDTAFAYWHVVPLVAPGDRVQAFRTVIGRVAPGAGHVHFSDTRSGRQLNPLRRGGLHPYEDATTPSIRAIVVHRRGRRISSQRVRGRVAIIADGLDWPYLPTAIPPGDVHRRVAPALVRWRLQRGGTVLAAWRTIADFRLRLPPAASFDAVYAPGSQGNWRNHPGRYRFYVLRDWDTARLRNGSYVIVVRVADVRGNSAVARFRFTVRN